MKEKIGLKIRTLSHLIRRGIDDKINSSGLSEITGVQGFVIGYLYSNRNRDIFQRDLEKQFNLRRSSITSVLNNLEKKAYIRREEVNNDKRLKKVVLTAKGMEHQDKIDKIIQDYEKSLYQKFTDCEITELFKLLNKLEINIKKGQDYEEK